MALDQDGVEELLDWVDPNYITHCPRHHIVFQPDNHVYRQAHTHCPVGGERLESYFARFRSPVPAAPDAWSDYA